VGERVTERTSLALATLQKRAFPGGGRGLRGENFEGKGGDHREVPTLHHYKEDEGRSAFSKRGVRKNNEKRSILVRSERHSKRDRGKCKEWEISFERERLRRGDLFSSNRTPAGFGKRGHMTREKLLYRRESLTEFSVEGA